MNKLLLMLGLAFAPLANAQIEKPDVHIAVGGKTALYYLPLTITERLGYFRLIDRVRRGVADPQEVLATQEKYDNHFIRSKAWNDFAG